MRAQDDQILRDALNSLRKSSFPGDSPTSDTLSELHAELAEYDGHVAGVVASLLGGSRVEPRLLEPDLKLRSRLELFAENASEPLRSEARQHLSYCERLDRLLDIAREMACA